MESVRVCWDMESCPLPTWADPFLVMGMANTLIHNFGIQTNCHTPVNLVPSSNNDCNGVDLKFSAYKFSSSSSTKEEIELEQTVFNSDIDLQLLHSGRIDEIEKMIMADVLLWAMDVPPPANIIFIVGNVDFSYVFYKLRERFYNVFLVCTSVDQMPQGMLNTANGYTGWLTFLKLLEPSEEKMHLPSNLHGWDPEHYQDFSNTYPSSVSTVSSKEREECHSTSTFDYGSENYLIGQSCIGGWESTQSGISPLNEAATTILQPPEGHEFQGHGSKCHEKPMGPEGHGFQGHGSKRHEKPMGPEGHGFQGHGSKRHEKPMGPKGHGFQGYGSKGHEKPMGPAESRHRNQNSSASTQRRKKFGSLAEFKAWLRQVVNRKENENGYNISPIRVDFEKATGKNLDLNFLGFQKISNLLEQCKDVVELKEVRKGCHMAFPSKPSPKKPFKTNKEKGNPDPMKGKPESSPRCPASIPNSQPILNPKPNLEAETDQDSMPKAKSNPKPMKGKPENSLHTVNPNSEPNLNPIPKLEAEADQNKMPKAEKEDFLLFLIHMVNNDSFSQGYLLSKLPKEFESVFGKCLDLRHLGYQKLTNLLEEYSDIVFVDNKGPGPSRIYPSSGLTTSNLNFGITSEEISINMVESDLVEQKPGLEINNNSALGNSKNSSDNRDSEEYITEEHLCCQNTELVITGSKSSPMSLSSWPSVSFTPAEEKAPAFQEYCNKSASSETPRGLHVSEYEGQLPDKVYELCSHGNSGGLEGSEICSKEFLPSLQKHGNILIGNAFHTEVSVSEALQNVRLNRENGSGKQAVAVIKPTACQNSSYDIAVGKGLLNGLSSQWEPPILNPKMNCNLPFHPLQPLPEESIDCSGDLQCSTGLECKVNELNAKSEVQEETNENSIVSPGGAILQAAGRGLKTICEFTGWKKNQ